MSRAVIKTDSPTWAMTRYSCNGRVVEVTTPAYEQHYRENKTAFDQMISGDRFDHGFIHRNFVGHEHEWFNSKVDPKTPENLADALRWLVDDDEREPITDLVGAVLRGENPSSPHEAAP